MVVPLRTIADLLDVVDGAPDDSGGLALAARLLAPTRCERLFLADPSGRLIAVEGRRSDDGLSLTALAERVARRLADARCCQFRSGGLVVFGIRAEGAEKPVILGGCCHLEAGLKLPLRRHLPALAVCAEMALRLVQVTSEQRKVRVENRHLRAEHCTLKAAHTEATIEAVREREERLALEAERIALEQFLRAAEQANASKSQFLASVAHEIRTPMTAILGFTEVLRQRERDAEQIDALDTIKKNGEYLLDIINDVLDIAKIEAGKLEVERVPCSPLTILNDVVSLMRMRAEAKGLTLGTDLVGAVPKVVLTDPIRARQILINLVGNAIKFTEHGEVRIVTQIVQLGGEESHLQFDVMDTGVGISPERLRQLFRPYSQGGASIGRTHGGTGLGLVISKRLAEMLGGDIEVASTAGQGSTFRVTLAAGSPDRLPQLAQTAGMGELEGDAADEAKGELPRIQGRLLLAEDSPDNQRVISFFLKRAGAEVAVVDNGKAAVEAFLAAEAEAKASGAQRFSCVLLDIDMPIMNGFEAARQMRLQGYRGPMLALTAHAMVHEVERCLEAGFDCHVAKPIDWGRLLRTIAKLAEQRQSPFNDAGRRD